MSVNQIPTVQSLNGAITYIDRQGIVRWLTERPPNHRDGECVQCGTETVSRAYWNRLTPDERAEHLSRWVRPRVADRCTACYEYDRRTGALPLRKRVCCKHCDCLLIYRAELRSCLKCLRPQNDLLQRKAA